MKRTESLANIYPTSEPNKPTYWGKRIRIPGLGKVGLEVRVIRDKPAKHLEGLRFILRNGEKFIDLGAPHAPIYAKGNSRITYGYNLTPSVPETLYETPGDNFSHEAIFTGFQSRTLNQALDALGLSSTPREQKNPMLLFLFLKSVSTLQAFHEPGRIHGDLHGGNIIVDDSLQAIHLIDVKDAKKTFDMELRKLVSKFTSVLYWGKMEDPVGLTAAEIEIPYYLYGNERAAVKKADELINLAKTRLATLGYQCDTQEEQNETANRLEPSYRKIQILGSFTVDYRGPILPLPTDTQYNQLVAAMDKLVATAPTVTFPENQRGWRWRMRHILPPR